MADYGGCYIWDDEGAACCLEDIFPTLKGIADLQHQFELWQSKFERHLPDLQDGKIHHFDWSLFHEEGISLCRKLKEIVRNDCKIFYWKPFEDGCNDNCKYEILLNLLQEGKTA
jgi:hypothetical protein